MTTAHFDGPLYLGWVFPRDSYDAGQPPADLLHCIGWDIEVVKMLVTNELHVDHFPGRAAYSAPQGRFYGTTSSMLEAQEQANRDPDKIVEFPAVPESWTPRFRGQVWYIVNADYAMIEAQFTAPNIWTWGAQRPIWDVEDGTESEGHGT